MRWTMILGLLCAVLGFSEKAFAVEKIAYVDMAQALNDVEDGKAAKARLKADFEGKQQRLDKMQTDLKAKKEEFDKKSSMMKPEIRQSSQEDLQRQFMELQQTYMKLQQELMDKEGQITQEIGRKIKTVIDKIGDRDGYTMILNIGDTVMYYKRHQDITQQVVLEYNKQYGGKK